MTQQPDEPRRVPADGGRSALLAAVDLVLSVPPADLSPEDSLARTDAVLQVRSRLRAAELAGVRDMDTRELHKLGDAGSVRTWLGQRSCAVGGGSRVRLARRLATSPAATEALATGTVGSVLVEHAVAAADNLPAAVVLAAEAGESGVYEVPGQPAVEPAAAKEAAERVAGMLADGIPMVLGRVPDVAALKAECRALAEDLNVPVVERIVTGWLLVVRHAPTRYRAAIRELFESLLPAPEPGDEDAYAHRAFTLTKLFDGWWRADGDLAPEFGDRLNAEIEAAVAARRVFVDAQAAAAEAAAQARARSDAEATATPGAEAGAEAPTPTGAAVTAEGAEEDEAGGGTSTPQDSDTDTDTDTREAAQKAAGPTAAEPDAAQPARAGSDPVEPGGAEPHAAEPARAGSDPAEPGGAEPHAAEPGAEAADPSSAEPTRPTTGESTAAGCGLLPSAAAQRHDALVVLLSGGAAPRPAVTPLTIVITAERLDGRPGVPAARTSSGHPVTDAAVGSALCSASITTLVRNARGQPLDLGRSRRDAAPWQRTALNGTWGPDCAALGCGNPSRIPHHVEPWGEGGDTDIDDLVPVCPVCHDDVHLGGSTIVLRDGSAIGPHGWVRRPPRAPEQTSPLP